MNFRKPCYSIFELMFGEEIFNAMARRAFGEEDKITDYSEKSLYRLLASKNVSVSAINQIVKLRALGVPLEISEAIELSTDELREMVKDYGNI